MARESKDKWIPRKSLRLYIVFISVCSLCLAAATEIAGICALYLVSTKMGHQKLSTQEEAREWKLHRNQGSYDRIVDRFVRPMNKEAFAITMVTLLVVGIILFTIYFLLLTRKLQRDLKQIVKGIQSVTEEEEVYSIQIDRQDEIGMLADAVNTMTRKVNQLMLAEREKEQQKKDLIASVAHDLRTPLTSVMGYLELASAAEKYDEKKRQEFLEIATQKAYRLSNLTEDLFSYTKLASGEISVKRGEIDVVQLVCQMIEEFFPLFEEEKLECVYHSNVDSCILWVDGELIARAVQNLLSNAIKYGKDGKRILLDVEKNPGQLSITVTNFGKIIPKDSLELIFEKFYRVEGSRSTQTGGSGLGLNIVREIAMLHEGKVEVESDMQGTRFRMYLPVTEENRKGGQDDEE